MLQPFEYDPSEKNNHKFMVQSLIAPSGNFEQDQLVSFLSMRRFITYMCINGKPVQLKS